MNESPTHDLSIHQSERGRRTKENLSLPPKHAGTRCAQHSCWCVSPCEGLPHHQTAKQKITSLHSQNVALLLGNVPARFLLSFGLSIHDHSETEVEEQPVPSTPEHTLTFCEDTCTPIHHPHPHAQTHRGRS